SQQRVHRTGLGRKTARTDRVRGAHSTSYECFYGKKVPVSASAVLYPGPSRLLLGIGLAGPNLTPQTFQQGMFRWPPISGYVTSTYVSWGNKLWSGDLKPDYNSSDDATTWWWDTTAKGQDEAGNEGTGMPADVGGGRRYLPGDWPTDPIPYFQKEGSVTVYKTQPDDIPSYGPWPGSPAAANSSSSDTTAGG